VYAHTSEAIGNVTGHYFGANLPIYLGHNLVLDTTQQTLMKSTVSFLRYPGGSSANKYLWDVDFTTYPYFSTWSWMAATAKYNMSAFATTIKATGAKPLVELNACLALVYGYDVAAAYFVRQHEALLALGINVTFYEFGNENYGAWEPPYGDYPINGSLYGAAFVVAREALQAKYPYVQLGLVVRWDSDSDTDGGRHGTMGPRPPPPGEAGRVGAFVKDWMKDLLVTAAAATADFYIVHEYFTSGEDAPTDESLLDEVALLPTMASGVRDMLAQYAPAVTMPPLYLTEFNIAMTSTGGCGATLQYINALWHADFLGTAMTSAATDGAGFASVVSFSWADSAGTCTYTGRGATGDYGMVSYENDAVADGTPTPQLYSYALWRLAAGDTIVNATVAQGNSTKLRAYPSTFADGNKGGRGDGSGAALGLVLVNEDSVAHTIRLASSASPKLATAVGWVVASSEPDAADPLAAAGVTWNGEPSPAGSLFPLDEHLVSYSLTADAPPTPTARSSSTCRRTRSPASSATRRRRRSSTRRTRLWRRGDDLRQIKSGVSHRTVSLLCYVTLVPNVSFPQACCTLNASSSCSGPDRARGGSCT